MDSYFRWLVHHPLVVLAGNLLITAILGSYALGLRIQNDLENVLPAGDPAITYYDEVRATFGSDNVAVVGVVAADVLAGPTLVKIKQVTDAIGRMDGVQQVLSITNAVDPAEDVLSPPPLVPHIPPVGSEATVLRHKLESRPLYGKNLVSDDFHGAAINVFFAKLTQEEYREKRIDENIRQLLDAEVGPERFYYTGAAHLEQAALDYMRRDLVYFTPIALLVVVVVLFFSFRTARGILLPGSAVLLAVVWTLGIMALAGKALSLGTFILPALILVIGSASSMHVMSRYYEEVQVGPSDGHTVERALMRVSLPLLISALTTAVGFGSLALSRIPAIRDLGLFAAVGMASLAVSMLSFLPATLQLLGVGRRGTRSIAEAALLGRFLTTVGGRAYRNRRTILSSAAVVVFIALVGANRIRVDSDPLAYFGRRSEVWRSNDAINRQVVGTNPFYLVVEGSKPGRLARWDALRQIKDLQTFLSGLPGITSSISVVDYLELLEAGLNKSGEGDLIVDDKGNIVPVAQPLTFWEDPKNLEPLLNMIRSNPGPFARVITSDFSRANIIVRTQLSGSRAIEERLAEIRRYIARQFPAELRVRPTGTLVLFTGTSSEIVAGQVKSLSLALGVIFAVMALMFLSIKVGSLAMLPNLLSITFFFGLIGWGNVVLNLGTSLIATIALGLAVDATIHYMARLNLELRKDGNQEQAVVRALRAVGQPIVHTSIGLCLGFFVLGLSNFVPVKQFGLLTGLTLMCALVANVVVLPALLATTKIITLWDLLTVKLGEDPARTIPLFAGLRPAQARIVVLMGEIRRFKPQELIVRRGERSDAMFVIIQGVAEVWAGTGTERRRIVAQRRGDVFGEMGLVRRTERSADVVAVDQVEVLAVDQRFLRRIQMRYPRIASKVFLNLSRILSDRLQRMTDQYVATDH
jgi:predicted RND superfamily exporter protein